MIPAAGSRYSYILAASTIISSSIPILTHLTPLEPFTPRALIHSHRFIPIFLSPWATPSNHLISLSRLFQLTLTLLLPASARTYILLYLYSFLLGVVRTIVGFVLSRSVGWAYPPLFSHWAVYEPTTGIGPVALAGLALGGQEDLVAVLSARSQRVGRVGIVPLMTLVFCWLERAPWTYGLSILTTTIMIIGRYAYRQIPQRRDYAPLAPGSPDSTLLQAAEEDEKASTETLPTSIRSPLSRLALSLLAVLIPYFMFEYLPAPIRRPFPPSSGPSPLLDILILSYPRPVDTAFGAEIISTTLSSFTPFLAEDISLSVFTHASIHPAFDLVQADSVYAKVAFYTDHDTHPEDEDDQYLHLSEAFRLMYERENRGEWMMLVEDDFPLCEGVRGWEVISTVLAMLEQRRLAAAELDEVDIGSGMIGTGGSGIIIRHSRLPFLSHLLRMYSSQYLIPATVHRPPPDVLIQDCLIGRPGGICERDASEKGRLIISSRLVLDHIGGMATTTAGKQLNSDKWRCGWRSGLHGEEGVDVVVV